MHIKTNSVWLSDVLLIEIWGSLLALNWLRNFAGFEVIADVPWAEKGVSKESSSDLMVEMSLGIGRVAISAGVDGSDSVTESRSSETCVGGGLTLSHKSLPRKNFC